MTDIIVLHNFCGRKRGQIIPLEPWMDEHIGAGNAKVLPGVVDSWDDGSGGPQAAPEVLQGVSTGVSTSTLYDIDEDTAAILDEEE